jgi:hypothetical protein
LATEGIVTMLKRLAKLLVAALAAPFAFVWDGARWVLKALRPAAYPGADLDPVDAAEDAAAQLRASIPPVPPEAAGEHPYARTCIAWARHMCWPGTYAHPEGIADLDGDLRLWLCDLNDDEKLVLADCLPYVVDQHTQATWETRADLIPGLRPVPGRVQSPEELAVIQDILADLMKPEPEPHELAA